MVGKGILPLVMAAGMLLAGCRGRGLLSSDVVAQVGKTVLTEEDVTAAVPAGMSGEDSLAMVENYVETWVRRQVKLQEAERVLAETGVNIDAMVEDYRNSLLTYRIGWIRSSAIRSWPIIMPCTSRNSDSTAIS